MRADWTASEQPKMERTARERRVTVRKGTPVPTLGTAVGRDSTEEPRTDPSVLGQRKKTATALKSN